jgi:hypothetical protein
VGRPTDTVKGQGQPRFTHRRTVWEPPQSAQRSSRWLGLETVGVAIRSPQLQPKRCGASNGRGAILVSVGFGSTRRCVKSLAALPRMLTPVAGFRRLLEPSPQSIPTSDVPWVTLGHRRVRSSGPISCLSTHLAARVEGLPQSLGPPCPPTCLGSKGVKPRTSDTVIRPDMGLDPREPLSPRVRSPRENLDWSLRETGAPSSPSLRRPWSSGFWS